jgi:hypothetical protein
VVTWSTPLSLPGATPGTCTRSSGSTFSFGATTVTCQVLDDQGDVATGTFTVTVNRFPTTTSLSSSTNPAVVGQQVSYTATVSSGAGDPAPTGGFVDFYDRGAGSGFSLLCSAPLSGGSASCSATLATTGAHNILAGYSGSAAFADSNSPFPNFTEVVTRVPCNALAGCDLSGVNLSFANLVGADLQGANLKGANLSGAFLSGANLSGANLMGANLNDADLTGANLKGANLSGANLNFASLSGANLVGANLKTASLIFVGWGNTTCPDGSNSDNEGGTCVGHL